MMRGLYEPDALTESIISGAIEVHRALGPGLLESVYEEALCVELRLRALEFRRQVAAPVTYKGYLIGTHRPDLIVEEKVLVEVKSVTRLEPVHHAQILSYMRLLNLHVGLLMNFNGAVLKDGLRRFVLKAPDEQRGGENNSHTEQ